jgi:hypothetical protein
MTRSRHTRQEWVEILSEFERSGQSAEDFAAEKHVQSRTLLWWKTAIKRSSPRKQAKQPPIKMLPVAVKSSATPGPSLIEIVLGETVLRFPNGTDAEYVGALLLELKTSC